MRVSTLLLLKTSGLVALALAGRAQSYSLDPSFGTGGKAVVSFPATTADDVLTNMAVQANGQVVLCGRNNNGFGLARLTTVGQPDATFGTAGTNSLFIDSPDYAGQAKYSRADALAIQPDGKIVVAGVNITDFPNYQLYVRYTTAGIPDASFGAPASPSGPQLPAGVGVGYYMSYHNGRFAAVELEADNKILGISTVGTLDGSEPMVSQLSADGIFDTNYHFTFPLPASATSFVRAGAGMLDASGNLLVTGDYYDAAAGTGAAQRPTITRILKGGSYDASFGTNGYALLAPSLGSALADLGAVSWSKILTQPDGKIVVASPGAVARFLANGMPDASFGKQGLATVEIDVQPGSTGDAQLCGLELTPAGELLAGVSVGMDMYFIQLSTAGQPVAKPFVTHLPGLTPVTMLPQPDGKLLVAGNQPDAAGTNHFAVARLLYSPLLGTASPATAQVQLYPNPAAGAATVRVTGAPATAPLRLLVVDALGREVLHLQATPTAGEVQLPLADLRPGTYAVRVQGENFTVTQHLTHIQ